MPYPPSRGSSLESGRTVVDISQQAHDGRCTLPTKSRWRKALQSTTLLRVLARDKWLIETGRVAEPREDLGTLDDERMMKDGFKEFETFKRRIADLNAALSNLCNTSRQLNSSFHVTRAATRLENRQKTTIPIFRRIAVNLFPAGDAKDTRGKKHGQEQNSDHTPKLDGIDLVFKAWAIDIEIFVDSINRFPGYAGKDISERMGFLSEDLKYWSSCLEAYRDRFQNDSAVQKYIHCLGIEMGEHIEGSTGALLRFIEKDIPLVFQTQQNASSSFLTVSTLFCAVTATTLQFSYSQHSPLYNVVNLVWFLSLGLSIAASVFTLLRALWKDTVTSHWPDLNAPLMIIFIVEGAPLGFLVASIVTFSIGLCFFAFASSQSRATVYLTTSIASICTVGLVIVLLGFIPEYSHRGHAKIWRHLAFMHWQTEANKLDSAEKGESRNGSYNHHNEVHRPILTLREDSEEFQKGLYTDYTASLHRALVRQAVRNRRRRDRFTDMCRMFASLQTEAHSLHGTSVGQMQFSPNGKYLATCSQDRTCLILDVQNISKEKRAFGICKGHARQVAWSSQGDYILTRLQHNILLWEAPTGPWKATITRDSAIQQVLWFPTNKAFLSVEGDKIVKFGIDGQILDTYNFDNRFLHAVAITNDEQYLVCIAALKQSPTGLRSSGNTRKEKQILAYKLRNKTIESQVPILYKVRHVAMSVDDRALVSYEGSDSPQLWSLSREWDKKEQECKAKLTLERTYLVKAGDEFTTPSCFGGVDDELVICARKSGDIHIWDRGSAFLRHFIPAPTRETEGNAPEVMSLAWNTARRDVLFVTGRYDGSVKVWRSFDFKGPRGSETSPSSG